MARFVPIWIRIEPSSAATNAPGRKTSRWPASDVPTSTGATAAGSVRTRAAISQMRTAGVLEATLAMAENLVGRLAGGEAAAVRAAAQLVGERSTGARERHR